MPCIGSQTHKTFAPDLVTPSTSAGKASRIFPAPIRVIKVMRPGSRFGSSLSMSASASSTVDLGPSLIPIGFRTFEAKST